MDQKLKMKRMMTQITTMGKRDLDSLKPKRKGSHPDNNVTENLK